MQKDRDIKEAWNDIYKDEVINRQVDPEKVENWIFISSNKDINGVGNEKKALLNDDADAFSKQQSKEKQEKGDKKVKWQYNKGK